MRLLLIASVLVSMNCYVYAQNSDSVLFKTKLVELESAFDLKFSYLEDFIEGKYVQLPTINSSISVDSLLSLLQGYSGLKFERVGNSDKYVVIRDLNGSDKVAIYGQVFDEKGKPLEAALIQINGSGGAITNRHGTFRISDVSFDQKVVVSYLGFDKKVVAVSDLLSPTYQSISLKSNLSFVGEYVLEDYSLQGITKVQNKLVFNPEKLRLVPGWVEPDIMQAIQLSPGVSTPFESSSNLYIRGSTPDQNLVLWNGIKTYDQSHFFGAISAFNPVIPQTVEFVKSGAEPFYGDRVAGVIDIKTTPEIPEVAYGSAGLNLLSGDVHVEVPIVADQLSISVSGRRSYSDIIETPTYTQFADRAFQNTKILLQDTTNSDSRNNQFFFSDFTASALFKPNRKHSFRFNTILTENELDFRSASTTTSYRDFLNTGSEGFNLQWQANLTSASTITVEPYYVNYGLFYRFDTENDSSTTFSLKNNLVSESGLKALFELEGDRDQETVFGFQWSNNRIRYAFNQRSDNISVLLDNGDESLQSYSIFGKHAFKWKALSVDVGSRINYLNTWNKLFIEPRAKVSYSFPRISFGATYEYRTQTVSQIRESIVSDLSLENQVWTLSSPEGFPIITSSQYTGSVAIDYEGWIVEAEVYNRSLEGITSLTFGFLNPNPADNEYRVGSSLIRGIDVFVQKKVKAYTGVFSYSYINTENQFTGLFNDASFPGNWNIRHLFKFNQFYTWNSIDFSLGWVWHSGKVFTESEAVSEDGETVSIDFARVNSSILPRYHRLDLSAMYKFTNEHNVQYRIGLSILNCYNRQNLINRELRKEPTLNLQLLETEFYGLSITPNLVFRVLW